MRHYCTYFDSNYLSRGLLLYGSLCEHEKEFTLYVLCLDDNVFDFFQQHHFDSIVPIAIQDFEDGDTNLIACKANRNRVEYIFTCSPTLLLYIFNKYNQLEQLTYLDADLFFYASPDPVFKEAGDSSIVIIAHRFSERNKHLELYGIYNVGFLSFRNDVEGIKCLKWWRNKCIEWCCDYAENGRFADQKYLDEWPTLFKNVCIVQHKGANLAPWNIDNYYFKTVSSKTLVNDDPLIFYHFHGLGSLGKHFFKTNLEAYCDNAVDVIILNMYRGYIANLQSIANKYDLFVCMTRNYNSNTNSIIRLSFDVDIVCYFYPLPIFSLSRIVRNILPIYKKFINLLNNSY